MDENYQCLKEEATKTKQALENAFTEKESHKLKLESIYKMMNKTDDELNEIFLEIESDKKNTTLPLDEEYNNSYWKWKDADEANEKAQTALKKYDENYNADIPDVMIELKEVKQQNEELRKEMQRQNEELKKQNEELKNEMEELKAILPQMMMQQNEEVIKAVLLGIGKMTFANGNFFEGDFQNGKPHGKGKMTFANGDYFEGDFQNGKPHQGKTILARNDFSNITPAFNGQNKEVDIVFPEPVEARYITFKPKEWTNCPHLRCEVYVDNVLQNTPLNQRSISSCYSDSNKDSTMNARYGWVHKQPYNNNEWLKLDLQQCKNITGIRVGTSNNSSISYVSKFALEFGN